MNNELNRDYGTTQYKGEVYAITCEAWVDNIGTNGDVVYYAYATRYDKKYRVMWYTTERFNFSNELFKLEEKLKTLKDPNYISERKEKLEIEKRIEELESQGIESWYCEQSENACDWGNADEVEEVED